jgi:hypothetical protein
MESVIAPIIIKEASQSFLFFMIMKKISKFRDIYKIANFFLELKSINNDMNKLYKTVVQLYVKTRLSFENRREEKFKQRDLKMQYLKRQVHNFENEKNEKSLSKNGLYKCRECNHYTTPDLIYTDVKDKVLDLNSEYCDMHFNCRKCNQIFKSQLLEKLVQREGCLKTVDYFKEKSDKMVYLNLPVLRYENKIVNV